VCLSPRAATTAFSDAEQSFIVSSHCVLASHTTLRIFSLKIKNGSGKPLSVTMSLLHKVSNEIVPDYIRMLPPNQSMIASSAAVDAAKTASGKRGKKQLANAVPDLVIFDKQGNMGLLSSISHSPDEIKESVFTLVHGPLVDGSNVDENVIGAHPKKSSAKSSTESMMASCAGASVLVVVIDGVPHVYNSSTGLEVPQRISVDLILVFIRRICCHRSHLRTP
jgi:hypothetical protein